MSESPLKHNINGKPDIKPEVYMEAQRMSEFLKHFLIMSNVEKKACIDRIDSNTPYELVCFLDYITYYPNL